MAEFCRSNRLQYIQTTMKEGFLKVQPTSIRFFGTIWHPDCISIRHENIFIEFKRNFKERNAMISNNIFDRDLSVSYVNSNLPKHRYAWLEKEGNMWHFLTNLFADPAKSTRRWANKQRALEELTREGWTVLYPYPEQSSQCLPVRNNACGYGLMWIDQ
jgi:hypothetical protein